MTRGRRKKGKGREPPPSPISLHKHLLTPRAPHQTQGHIWHAGFARGELTAELYGDVPDALVAWQQSGLKTYIYSSGSRMAQRDLFGHTAAGDLRPHLSGYFDTTSGPKTEASSYDEIALALGAAAPSELLFATDVLAEARAAAAAGWRVALAVRPGNAALPGGHGFPEVASMAELLHLPA